MNIKELHKKYLNKELTVEAYIKSVFENIKTNNYHAYISLNEEAALDKAKKLDEKLKDVKELSPLFGVPVAIKDNILTKGLKTTAGSKSLSNYVPIYNADLIEKLNLSDYILIGKTNMDEFAMGSSSETSHYETTINPYDPSLTPGGSSGGSAAAVAADEAIVSLGTDTGGSSRNPADFCHIVGFAPSYGAISRYGVISMSNSLDRVGIMAKNVSDVKTLFDQIRGKSENDFTSLDFENNKEKNEKLRIAKFNLRDEYKVDPDILKSFNESVEKLETEFGQIETVDVDYLEYINSAYTVIMSIEVEANMARIDGLRYGESVSDYENTDDFYIQNRTENFGEEVKRRLALGNFFASKDNNQVYYKKAMQVRQLVKKQMDDLLDEYDVILSPTTTLKAKKVGETSQDANASFDSGLFNTITNLSNLPAISIPMKDDQIGSLQIIGKRNDDLRLLDIAEEIEGLL
ncbi:amidase family protein [uncultured Helcococcus sp.]|uniref:amidase family protein n=1 Tax=uncultured Helcococcus sp. TaxID=1072508 RepID=UPI0026016D80|nr:amidase family protein [uncultured Helcococcus sp.]